MSHYSLILIFILSVFSLPNVMAQTLEEEPKEIIMVNPISGRTEMLSNLWLSHYLNKRCDYLSEEQSVQFELNILAIENQIGSDNVRPSTPELMAKGQSEQSAFKQCGEQSSQLVTYGFEMSEILSELYRVAPPNAANK